MDNVKCSSCQLDTTLRTQVGGQARICGHQARFSGNAYCLDCAIDKTKCAVCGKSLEEIGEPHSNIILGED